MHDVEDKVFEVYINTIEQLKEFFIKEVILINPDHFRQKLVSRLEHLILTEGKNYALKIKTLKILCIKLSIKSIFLLNKIYLN